jgi:hypothetical protein
MAVMNYGLLCVFLCVLGGCPKPSTPESASAPTPAPATTAKPARVTPLTSKQPEPQGRGLMHAFELEVACAAHAALHSTHLLGILASEAPAAVLLRRGLIEWVKLQSRG